MPPAPASMHIFRDMPATSMDLVRLKFAACCLLASSLQAATAADAVGASAANRICIAQSLENEFIETKVLRRGAVLVADDVGTHLESHPAFASPSLAKLKFGVPSASSSMARLS